jgi:cell wall assembly regulator SMI1
MIEEISECGPPLNDENVRLLENELGFSLPKEYRDFLLRYNGGRPIPRAFPIRNLTNNPFGVIQVFFRIGGDFETSTLIWNWEIHNGRIPSNLFPIACDDGGDLICISLFGDDAESVVFWDYHQETNEPTYDNVYHIADSFEEFLESIQELPEP